MAEKLTKNERREQARERARLAQEEERRRQRRRRLMIQGGIVVGVLAVLAIVALILSQTLRPAGPGPLNMASGGAVFTKGLQVVETPALQPGEERQAPDADFDVPPTEVSIYVDYMCPYCGAFEQQYGSVLRDHLETGDINLEVYPINFLDSTSLGSKYSTRAANLFACVVEQQPDVAFTLHNTLLSAGVQPEENTTGLTDEQLLDQAEAAGAENTIELRQCVREVRFGAFIAANYKAVSETGVQGLADGAQLIGADGVQLQAADQPQRLVSTPTVIVNGRQWNQAVDGDFAGYLEKVVAAAGQPEEEADAEE
ncbi:DsbA family protein [Leucobacter massiliensis]|uniref:Disulfide bond formation protein DsbA n=1 Tax=Leucobacter massiliensis TaxID=1686285 RepID=A0A2S9QR79_9MICO|nr:thioredoxin domain-containing protein [Leucobacter massiliensis]PRI12091.1 disulfide bond formation protein DsbA [Leucobacter massiliensis]